MAKKKPVDIWSLSPDLVKKHVEAVICRIIAEQDNQAELEESGGDNEAADAHRHAAAVVAKIKQELFRK